MIFTIDRKRSLYLVLFGLALHFSAYASNSIDGTWVLDKTIPSYCDRHPEPYTFAELKAIEKMQSGLPNDFKLSITGTAAKEIVGEFKNVSIRFLNIKEKSLEPKEIEAFNKTGVRPYVYLAFLAGIPENALPRVYELRRSSPLGQDYLELLNVDVETCGLNNAVATLKLVK